MKPPRLKITPAFPAPFIETELEDCEALNRDLTSLFLAREGEGEKYRNPNQTPGKHGLFESDFDLFTWPEDCVQKLRQFCLNSLAHTVAELSGYSQEELQQLEISNHTWFHVTRDGGYTTAHNHPMASWSGVYCVDPGTSSTDKPDSGILRFEDTRALAQMYQDAGNCRLNAPFGFGSFNFRLKAGQLVMFPSYIVHEVAPYFGEEARITVAFNSWIKRKDLC